MITTLLAAFIAASLAPNVAGDDCDALHSMIRDTYTFRPSELTRDEKNAAAASMQKVWEHVQAAPETYTECLREELRADDADPWFRFDGSALLVQIDPSEASKALQTELWCEVDFAQVDLQYWLELLLVRAGEGFDVTVGAERWLAHENPHYSMPSHGLFAVRRLEGALFLFGGMDEARATPALIRIAAQEGHRGRFEAVQLLTMQATPAAWTALGALDTSDFPPQVASLLAQMKHVPPAPPTGESELQLSREAILSDLRARLGDESAERLDGRASDEDWVRSAFAVLRPEDLPLLREVRRQRARRPSDEAVYEYVKLTRVIQALTWSPGYFK